MSNYRALEERSFAIEKCLRNECAGATRLLVNGELAIQSINAKEGGTTKGTVIRKSKGKHVMPEKFQILKTAKFSIALNAVLNNVKFLAR